MGCLGQKKGFDVSNHNTKADENAVEPKGSSIPCIPCRYYITILVFIAGCMINGERMALAIAVLKMSNYTSTPILDRINSTSCPIIDNSETSSLEVKVGGDFDWDSKVQGYILGVSFMGSVFSPMIMGAVSDIVGAKPAIFWGTFIAGIATLLSSIVSWWHLYVFITVQFVRGAAQSCITPSLFGVMAKWTPRKERAFIYSIMWAGYYSGSLIGGPISGYLCDTSWLGWPAVFYFFGGFAVSFSIVFRLTFYETPRDHPKISEAELKYITEDQGINSNKKKPPIPWLKMFTYVPTYAMLYGLIGRIWSLQNLLSVHPMYLSNVLHYTIAQNGLISSLPFLANIFSSLTASFFSDWLYRRKYASSNCLRKTWTLIGQSGVALSILGIYLAGCNGQANIVLLFVFLFFFGISTPGIGIAVVEMCPNFAATLMGIIMTLCNVTGVTIPIMVGYMTKNQTLEEWRKVFLINIAVTISSVAVFVIFGSAEVAPWNSVEIAVTKEEDPNDNNLPTVGEITANEEGNVTVTKI